jgi:hypothetical protein
VPGDPADDTETDSEDEESAPGPSKRPRTSGDDAGDGRSNI